MTEQNEGPLAPLRRADEVARAEEVRALHLKRLSEIDDAMWLLAREGDVRAAKLVYDRLAALCPPAPKVRGVPAWDDIKAMYHQVLQQQEGNADGLCSGMDDAADVGARAAG